LAQAASSPVPVLTVFPDLHKLRILLCQKSVPPHTLEGAIDTLKARNKNCDSTLAYLTIVVKRSSATQMITLRKVIFIPLRGKERVIIV